MTRILIVDDREPNLFFLTALLETRGFSVDSASDGVEALERARAEPPDLVISDLLMPVMDGYELLRQWRGDRALSPIPFVVFTATYTAQEDAELAFRLGADAFIQKPCAPDELLEQIAAVLARGLSAAREAHSARLDESSAVLALYNRTLIRKLEEKSLQLEEVNGSLRREVAERRTIEESQRAILDALPANIALVDATGAVHAVNASWRAFGAANGLTSPIFGIGLNYLDLCEVAQGESAADAKAAAAGMRAVLDGRRPDYAMEYSCHSPSEQRWFRMTVTPLHNVERGMVVVMHVDVTERRLAESAAEHSLSDQRALAAGLEGERARLAEAQSVAHVGSWEADLAHGRVSWSAEMFRIFEIDPSDFAGTPAAVLALVDPSDRPALTKAFLAPAGPGESEVSARTLEHRVVTPQGTSKVVEERWRIVYDTSGVPTTAIGTCQDITGRREAECSLRDSEERFRQLAENIDEVFWSIDVARSQMLYISPAFERIWGRSRNDLYHQPGLWLEAVHADDRPAVAAAAHERQLRGDYDERYRIIRPDGEIRWIRDRAFPVRNDSGDVYRIVGIADDITDRLRIEEQLLRSQRMESLGTLAGGIAHDLNNALTPILMSIDLLKESDTDPTRREILDNIDVSARQGADMVRQVLTFARGVEGRRVAVSIDTLVRGVQKVANDTFPKNISVRSSVSEALPFVLGDPTQLHQVLLNLCVNARDAMPHGGVLTLSAEVQIVDEQYGAFDDDMRSGEFVVVRVQDSGIGMTKDTLERIFEPFFTTKAQGHGTGLGLSTSQAIVHSHGGLLRVRSLWGGGSTFTVFLPTHHASAHHSEVPTRTTRRRGHNELVLVADDEIIVREITRRTLEAFGYRVLLASDGAEAVALFASHRADVAIVIVDMMMPVMDGPSMVRILRSMAPELPIVAMSGMADEQEFQGFIGTTITRLLAKPFTSETLLDALADALDAGRPGGGTS